MCIETGLGGVVKVLNCLFNGQRICSLDIYNEHNEVDFDLRRKWKDAQQRNELKCEDCGTSIDFRSGDTRTAYFAHSRGEINRDCYYDRVHETEELRDAKRLLYQNAKSKHSDCLVQVNKKLPNGKWAGIFVVSPQNEKLAIEFLRSNMPTLYWDEKHRGYVEMNIGDIWFLSMSFYNNNRVNLKFMAQLVERDTDGTAKFLDVANNIVRIVKEIQYIDKQGIVRKHKLFEIDYPLNKIKIDLSGHIVCDFLDNYEKAREMFIKESTEADAREEEKRRLHEESLKAECEKRQRAFFEKQQRVKWESSQWRQGERQAIPTVQTTTSISPLLKKREEWVNKINLADLSECERILNQCRVGFSEVQSRKKRAHYHLEYYTQWLRKCESMLEMAKRDGERANLTELKKRLCDPLVDLL